MKEKNTNADKTAKEVFNSPIVQENWKIHVQAFGPILEPAFVEDYQARVYLTEALNKISNRDVKGGLEKLKELRAFCESDADKAAWLFCMGLCFEMAGAKDQMLDCYQQAGQFNHKFYMPYFKVAKNAHIDGVLDVAAENYQMAICCLNDNGLNAQTSKILAALYTNMASCLTMMHRYEEAEEALEEAKYVQSEYPGCSAAEAILKAVKGNKKEALELLERAEKEMPANIGETRNIVEAIINETHPQFYPVNIDANLISEFWNWFSEKQEDLKQRINNQEYNAFFGAMRIQLKKVFPFIKRELEVGIEPLENGFKIVFADFYMTALNAGYDEIINACPDAVLEFWKFDIQH